MCDGCSACAGEWVLLLLRLQCKALFHFVVCHGHIAKATALPALNHCVFLLLLLHFATLLSSYYHENGVYRRTRYFWRTM